MHKALKWRDCSWINDSVSLTKCLIHLVQINVEKLQLLIVELISVILKSSRIILPQEQSTFIINKVIIFVL